VVTRGGTVSGCNSMSDALHSGQCLDNQTQSRRQAVVGCGFNRVPVSTCCSNSTSLATQGKVLQEERTACADALA
jgi:hypothetical protein